MSQEYAVNKFKVNGITVLHYPTSSKVTNIRINVLCGACNESKNEHGIAHFLEHLIFSGTPTHSSAQFTQLMSFLGAPYNAYTSDDVTCFYASVLQPNVEEVFRLLTDLVYNADFADKDVERERKIILEEVTAHEDNIDSAVFTEAMDSFVRTSFNSSVIGNQKDIKKITRKQLLNFKKKWYNRNNIQISIASDLPLADVKRIAKKYTKSLPDGEDSLEYNRNIKVDFNFKTLTIKKEGIQQAKYLLFMPAEIVGKGVSKELCAQSVFLFMLGGNQSSILFQEVREKKALCYNIQAQLSCCLHYNYALVGAELDPSKIEELEKTWQEIKENIDQHINDDTLAMFRNSILALMAMNNETSVGMNSTSLEELRGWSGFLNQTLEKTQQLTVQDIKDAAVKMLNGPVKKVLVLPKEKRKK